MDYLMMLKEHLRLLWHLRNGTKIMGAKFIKCYFELFLRWAATKIPKKIRTVGFVSED
jgi:hypothetical protein